MRKNSHRLLTLVGLLVFIYLCAVMTYSVVEGKGIFDACWWGLMTMTTVGYGDEYPHSGIGRIMGILLVTSAVFVIVPTLTAYIASRFIVDGDKWTHEEQEEVKDALRTILTRLEETSDNNLTVREYADTL